ncbi:prepilin-type N-terminal cleavage/methylation domain-containing protein [Candidatus Gottesmanbacteria bacterium]|nr:prepilin-type N-terminal cleavage/methylation domain-containing protein [Candidatus Gottesmanbacteria bacterium]
MRTQFKRKKHFSLFTFHFSLTSGFTLMELLIVIAIIGIRHGTVVGKAI